LNLLSLADCQTVATAVFRLISYIGEKKREDIEKRAY
jgi:hypothetical protein